LARSEFSKVSIDDIANLDDRIFKEAISTSVGHIVEEMSLFSTTVTSTPSSTTFDEYDESLVWGSAGKKSDNVSTELAVVVSLLGITLVALMAALFHFVYSAHFDDVGRSIELVVAVATTTIPEVQSKSSLHRRRMSAAPQALGPGAFLSAGNELEVNSETHFYPQLGSSSGEEFVEGTGLSTATNFSFSSTSVANGVDNSAYAG
jgi:hypothetical protein